MSDLEKTVSDSRSEMTQLVLPNDTNMLGNLLGGTLMHWIDLIGAIVANRHCRQAIVTASMERIDFLAPIPLGHLVILKGEIHAVGRTSMEIGVGVFAENTLSGDSIQAGHAILSYVAVDHQSGSPSPVPRLKLITDEERTNAAEAEERKTKRLKYRKTSKPGSAI